MSESPPPGAGSEASGQAHARSWFGSASDDDDDLVGATLGGSYHVVRILGEGAMGRVYEAHHTRIPIKRFAVKVLHPEFRRHPEALARFQREAEAAATITHRNVVGVYDVDVAPDGRPFIVCEHLDGVELGDYLDEVGKLTVAQAARIGRHLCDALGEAHAMGVVHRDIKPENVFLVGDPKQPLAKVLDFGLSRLEGPASNTLTKAGTVMGTPSYMAPEQARGSRVDARADVYGVGAILYRALTGHRPFEKDDPTATLAAVLTEDPPRPRAHDASIPEGLEAVIQRAMAKEPADRYQSTDELAAALEPYEDDPHAVVALAATQPPPPRSRMVTIESAEEHARQARHARPMLVVYGLLAFVWLTGIAIGGASSALLLMVDRGPDQTLSGTEVGLLAAAVLGVLITPVLLTVRHIRKHTWDNTIRVVKLLDALRAVLVASMAAYGMVALFVWVGDGVVGRFADSEMFVGPSGVAWPAWGAIFFAVSLLSGAAALLSRRWSAGRQSALRQLLAGPVLSVVTIAACASVLYAGLSWRQHALAPAEPAPEASAPEPSSEPVPSASAVVAATAPPASSSPPEPEAPAERAPASELDAAVTAGPAALAQLAERYPRDRAVLRALVSVYAKDKKGYVEALGWAGKLLEESQEEATWGELRTLALRAAQGDEPAATRAFELLTGKMAEHGADLLYDLMIGSSPSVRERAKRMLAHPEVRANGTPALLVAVDLKNASSCDEMVELLERAERDGDQRAIALLSFNVDGSRRGCGPRRNLRCAPKCDGDHAKRMRAAIKAIKERQQKG